MRLRRTRPASTDPTRPVVISQSPPTSEALDLAAVLLVVQAGLGLVAAAGVIFLTVLAAGAPLFVLASLAALAGPLLALMLARGLTRCRRWARNGAIVYEALILISAGVRLYFDREVALGLMVTLSSIVLPLAVCTLILNRAARRAITANRRPLPTPNLLPTHADLRPAA
ncbi:MAG: hypothetical protein ACRDJW_04215 [Thermomicrobiales bacterium]